MKTFAQLAEKKERIDDTFLEYFNDFYGPNGIYSKANKTGKPFTKDDLEKALSMRDKERKFSFEGDSTDRESLIQYLVQMGIFNPNY